jgi:hypothetical protein
MFVDIMEATFESDGLLVVELDHVLAQHRLVVEQDLPFVL